MQNKKRGIKEVLAINLQARMDADSTIGNQPLLSARSGVDQGYISRVLRQEAAITIEVLEKLAKGARCQPWELLVDDEATREAAIRKLLGKDAA
jgi:transcriptional regulator with XRE-family HTH domain